MKYPHLVLLEFDGYKGRNSVFLDLENGIFKGVYNYVWADNKQHQNRTDFNRKRAYSHSDVLNKRLKANRDRYGYDNYFSQTEVMKEHWMETLGVDNPLKSPEIQKKGEETYRENCEQRASDLIKGNICTANKKKTGTGIENKIEEYLKTNNIEYETQVYVDKYISDFYLPKEKLIIECDGLYWHSEARKQDHLYHYKKKIAYYNLGFKSLFFREDEINKDFKSVEYAIQRNLRSSPKIYALNCKMIIKRKFANCLFTFDFFNRTLCRVQVSLQDKEATIEKN